MEGFNDKFLGEKYTIKLPSLTKDISSDALNKGQIFPFTHFSLVMNKTLRSAIFVASNIDKDKLRDIAREDYWHYDERIGNANQIGNDYYKNNDWDRGHLGRRKDLCWGTMEEAKKGNYDSFCFANISLQHKKFNQGIWNNLEDWVLEKLPNESIYKKLSVITGPINKEAMDYYGYNNNLAKGVKIPSAFWKIIFYVNKEAKLKSVGFIMNQTKYFTKAINRDMELLKPYQVNLKFIANEVGLAFEDYLYDSDVLRDEATKEISQHRSYVIEEKKDLILN